MQHRDELAKAMKGDINAFHALFNEFKPELKAILKLAYSLKPHSLAISDKGSEVFFIKFIDFSNFLG